MGLPDTKVNQNVRTAQEKGCRKAKLQGHIPRGHPSQSTLQHRTLLCRGRAAYSPALEPPQIFSIALVHWQAMHSSTAPVLLISHHMRGSHAMACQGTSSQVKGHHASRTIKEDKIDRQAQQ